MPVHQSPQRSIGLVMEVDGNEIHYQDSLKYLGVVLDSRLS